MFEMGIAFLLVFSRYFCYNKGNKFVKVTHTMDYMHLLVGRPTQKSKKLEVCYILDDTTYIRPNRLKEDAKVSFIDWPDTVLGRLQAAYDRVPLKDDRDSVLVDYRKLVGCLKDAFIVLTEGSYEPAELFEETCLDSELRRVFLAALEIFEKDIPRVLRSKTNDVWDFLEELETSEIPDKAVFNCLQERYVDKGFSVFALPEALVGHHYGMIVGGSKTYQNSLFDLIRPFDALLLVHTSLTTLAKIEQGTFGSEMIDGQLLNVIGDWLHYLDDVVDRQVTLDELSKERRVASYEAVFEKFLVHMLDFKGVSLDLFSDVSLSSVVLDELNEELLTPNMLTSAKDDAIADSVSSEVIPFKQTTSLLDDSLVSLTTATSELTNDTVDTLDSIHAETVELSEAIASTSEEHRSNSLKYSEALLSEVAVDDVVKPVIDGEPSVTYVKQSVLDLVDSEVIVDEIGSMWSADNREFRELPSREQLEEYAVEKSVSLFDLEPKEDTIKPSRLDVSKKDTFYVDSSDVLPMEISKKNTFYVEPLLQVVSEDVVLDTTIAKKDMFHDDSQKLPIDYWHGQPLIVTDKKPGFYITGLEMALDCLPPKDVLKNVYVDYGPLRAAVQLCLMQDFFDVRVMIDDLSTAFKEIGRGDYALYDDLRAEKIKFLRSGLIRCLLDAVKDDIVAPLWDNQTNDKFGFDVKTVQQVLNDLSNTYGRNEGTIESWFSISDDIKRLVKQALSYVSSDTMFVKVPVSLKHTEFSDWLSDKECDALSQLLFFDAKKTDWYRSKAIEKDLMEEHKTCSLLPLDFLKDDTVTNPSRYRKNNIEAWDFTIQSLLPHPLATVAEYVIRYPYKGGREDLEKAIAWAQKAEKSLSYLQATLGYGDGIVDDLPKVTKEQFPDCSEGQRDVLRAVQKATLALRGSLGYGEPEAALRDVTDKVMTLLNEL